jgi:1,2-phenylacetyl-CoA epoxidase catalytic subunit
LKIKRSEKTKKSEIKKWDVGKLSKKEVKEEFIKKVTANVQITQNKWNIQKKYGKNPKRKRKGEKRRKEKKKYMKQLEN